MEFRPRNEFVVVPKDNFVLDETDVIDRMRQRKVDPRQAYANVFLKTLIAFVIVSGLLALSYYLATTDYLPRTTIPHLDKLANNFKADESFQDHYDQFAEFIRSFERRYKDEFETHRRFSQFRNNLKKIDELNRLKPNGHSVVYEVNEFADMSDEEIKEMLLPLDFHENLKKSAKFIKPQPKGLPKLDKAFQIPPRFDWRDYNKVTPSRSQHHCGSCWAFATVSTVESSFAVQKGSLYNLSQQELLDCNLENNACNGGYVDKAMQFVHNFGLMTADQYPYVAHRQNSCSLEEYEGPTTKVELSYFINPDENAMIEWLLNYGPVNVGIAVPPDMTPYKGGVYNPSAYDCKFRVLGLHALNIVGYGTTADGEKYWIVKNSWGPKWGVEQGYVYFARGVNACGIEDQPIGVIV